MTITLSKTDLVHNDLPEDKSLSEPPNLVRVQLQSFDWLKREGLAQMLAEISPIKDLTGSRFSLELSNPVLKEPQYGEEECRIQELTYASPISITVSLLIHRTKEVKEQVLSFGELPMMTSQGTFIINGAERVIVSQLIRSPGAYFSTIPDPGTGNLLAKGKLIPYRGASVELETSNQGVISVKVDRRRKLPVTTLLRALGWSDEEIRETFSEVDTGDPFNFIEETLNSESSPRKNMDPFEDSLLKVFSRIKPGEPLNRESAEMALDRLFFDPRLYDLGIVGRYNLNRQLGLDAPSNTRTLIKEDFLALTKKLIQVNKAPTVDDDVDHLGRRRVRGVGELIQNQLRVGFRRMEKVIRERMTTQVDLITATPAALINNRSVVASVREFFGGSQLSQFMDQTNPLAELTHKRRLSALGPGGMTRERAGFDVRDVHYSHYGRICPIETPEGPNIGLLSSLAVFARINQYGFIETPYRVVHQNISSHDLDIVGHLAKEDIVDKSSKVILQSDSQITKPVAAALKEIDEHKIEVQAYIRYCDEDIRYMTADQEEQYLIGQASAPIGSKGQIVADIIEIRRGELFLKDSPKTIQYIDIDPIQLVSASTALIPFLEHDDASRALMGSNMQRQAVPIINAEAPLVGTGMERKIAGDSGHMVISKVDGVVVSANSHNVAVEDSQGVIHDYRLIKFRRSNQGTCITQYPVVRIGQIVKKGQTLGDSSATDNGELALGQNLNVGFISWEGYNYEDAIVLSEDIVKEDRFTSIHIEKYETEATDTKLGEEEITRDIPTISDEGLKDLDENGIVRIGAWVGPKSILVGKIAPKGETELTAEERLLRAIFGEKAKDVKDASLRLPHGQRGKVIDITVEDDPEKLPHNVLKRIRVWVAHTRKIQEGDKMAGRHGNKGVVARIVPREDMPYLADGTPLDIVLNPLGVPSRLNLGQLLETHLGWAMHQLGEKSRSSVFDSKSQLVIDDLIARSWLLFESGAIKREDINDREIDWHVLDIWLAEEGLPSRKALWSDAKYRQGEARTACIKAWLKKEGGVENATTIPKAELENKVEVVSKEKSIASPISGKATIYDGRTGEPFDQPATIGNIYMLKLIHLVEDKIHARSTGPYSLVTQQPLGGKAQFGGQRFGEMEVWALEAYSAAYTLQEMLTLKSDDSKGRVMAYEAIIKGGYQFKRGLPESFHVLVKELQGLGILVETIPYGGGEDASRDIEDDTPSFDKEFVWNESEMDGKFDLEDEGLDELDEDT